MAVVRGTAVMRPIEPTRVATIGSATVSVLMAVVRWVPASPKMTRTGRAAPA